MCKWSQTAWKGLSGIPYHSTSTAPALGYVSLTAESVPASQLTTSVSELTSTTSVQRTDWGALPGGEKRVAFEVAEGDVVVLFADVANVQCATVDKNAYFRIIIDGTRVVANWDTGDSAVWDFDAISFHGVASDLGIGMHTAEIQFKVKDSGS